HPASVSVFRRVIRLVLSPVSSVILGNPLPLSRPGRRHNWSAAGICCWYSDGSSVRAQTCYMGHCGELYRCRLFCHATLAALAGFLAARVGRFGADLLGHGPATSSGTAHSLDGRLFPGCTGGLSAWRECPGIDA